MIKYLTPGRSLAEVYYNPFQVESQYFANEFIVNVTFEKSLLEEYIVLWRALKGRKCQVDSIQQLSKLDVFNSYMVL